MKNIYLCTCLFLVCSLATAQNLVHNPSFEQSTGCPTDTDQIDLVPEWFPAGIGADYYDSCCNNCSVDIPSNYMGYRPAYPGGKAYTGIYLYREYFPNTRGYISGVLDPMVPGHYYRVRMHVVGASKVKYWCISPQIFFYLNQTIPGNDQALPFTPQVRENTTISGPDSAHVNPYWDVTDQIFYADSAYNKMLIGNFYDDGHSGIETTIYPYPLTPEAHVAYNYIDEISVVDITAAYLAGLETEPLNVSAYPNPFTTYTNISIDAPPHQPYTLTLYNAQGQLLRQVNDIKGNNIVLQRDGLPAGFYYYHLNDKSVTVATGKLLIQ